MTDPFNVDKARTEVGIVAGNALNAACALAVTNDDPDEAIKVAERFFDWLWEKRATVGPSPWLGAPGHEQAVTNISPPLNAEVVRSDGVNHTTPAPGTSCPKCQASMVDGRQLKLMGKWKVSAPDWKCSKCDYKQWPART